MRPERMRTTGGFGSQLTLWGKRLLLFYAGVYVIELLFEHWFKFPIVAQLQLYPFSHPLFRFWQAVTHPFIHNPQSPFGFAINCLVFYFFAAPVEGYFGTRRFLVLFYVAAVGGALGALCFGGVAGFSAPFMGMLPSLLSLIVVFGLMNPEATILLMFILPVKAKFLSYATIIITLLTFLAKANPYGAYHLGGILFGYLYFKGKLDFIDPKRLYIKYLEWELKKRRSRFKVVDGYKDDNDEDDDKKTPTYH